MANPPIRIHHVISSLDFGGAEKHLASLAAAQADAGHRVHVTYLKGTGPLVPQLEPHRVVCQGMNLRNWLRPNGIAEVRHRLRSIEADVVHAHLFPAEVYAALGSLPTAPWKLVATKHNDEDFLRLGRYGILHRLTSYGQSAVICPTHYLETFTRKIGISPTTPIHVIPYGIDPSEMPRSNLRRSIRARIGVKGNEILFGFVGRFAEQKGLRTLLRAFQAAAKRIRGARLVLVGSGLLDRDLRRLADSLGLRRHVKFAGQVDNPWPWYQAMDVFVLPSLWEGFGRVLIEAMLCGLPIIATRVSSIPEVVDDARSGLLVEPDTPDGLSSALIRLGREPALRREMGRAGHHVVKTRFALRRMVRDTEAVYRSVLKRTS